MFENETREEILKRLLGRLPEIIDQREGSVSWDMLAPASIEFEHMYQIADSMMNLMFVDTSSDQFLELRCAEMGVYRKEAVKSTGTIRVSGSPALVIPAGTVASTGGEYPDYFISTSEVVIPEYPALNEIDIPFESEYGGEFNNIKPGDIKYITGDLGEVLTIVSNTSFTGGVDMESDTDLLDRYFDRILKPATSGNANQYEQWVKSVVGVGDCSVQPLHYGNGTVRILLLDTNKLPADQVLIDKVKEYIESVRPIGASVSVEAAAGFMIDISATLTLESGYTLEMVQPNIENAVKEYLESQAFLVPTVRYSRIANMILDTEGVMDYSDLLVNNAVSNISVPNDSVGILGVVNFV